MCIAKITGLQRWFFTFLTDCSVRTSPNCTTLGTHRTKTGQTRRRVPLLSVRLQKPELMFPPVPSLISFWTLISSWTNLCVVGKSGYRSIISASWDSWDMRNADCRFGTFEPSEKVKAFRSERCKTCLGKHINFIPYVLFVVSFLSLRENPSHFNCKA